jgi:DNA mismatch repair ATPase MutS
MEDDQVSEIEPMNTFSLEASVRKDLARYPDAILLTQVGSFYEVSSRAPLKLSQILH